MNEFISLDLSALLSCVFVAMSCAILGNYLLLKKESLIGDSISHSVLPGIVLAFMYTGSRAIVPVYIGALMAGLLSSVLIWLLVRFGRAEASSAMGVVFSLFFAVGVVLIESQSLRSVDLDPDCLLHGQVETIFWLPKAGEVVSLKNLFLNLPNEVTQSAIIMVMVLGVVVLFWKEFKLLCFDRGMCSAQGFRPYVLELVLLVLVSVAIVTSFKIVGSILVVALLVAPAASARLITNSLLKQFLISAFLSFVAVLIGYFLATHSESILGTNGALNVAGSIAVVLGAVFFVCFLLAPVYGVLPRLYKLNLQKLNNLQEDILGVLYRYEESGESKGAEFEIFIGKLYTARLIRLGLFILNWKKLVLGEKVCVLTDLGRERAKEIVRTHRMWEVFLSKNVGLDKEHVHKTAEELEHLRTPILEKELKKAARDTDLDPHGKPIP